MPRCRTTPIGLNRHATLRCLLAAVAMLSVAAMARAADAPDPVVAQRGAVTLTASEVRAMLSALDPEARAEVEHDPHLLLQRVRDRMVQLVLLDRARAEKWDTRPDIAYRAKVAKENAIAESYLAAQVPLPSGFPSEEQVTAAYTQNRTKLQVPRRYHLAQILVSVSPGDAQETQSDAARHASALRAQIVEHHKDFAELARTASDDKATADKGGDLGWLREDQMVPALRKALAGLPTGGVSAPVETADGWHIIKVLGIKPAGTATLAEAHDTLVRLLRQQRMLQLQRQYVASMLHDEPVRIDQVELWKQTAH